MLEKEVIQSVGFRNIKENGEIVGFQVKVRIPYYRGIFLCQLRPGTLYVDDMRFEKEDLVWNIGGKDHTYEEMKSDMETHWAVTEPAVIKVKLNGGTETGISRSYVGILLYFLLYAADMQKMLDPDQDPPFIMPEFGHHINKRRTAYCLRKNREG